MQDVSQGRSEDEIPRAACRQSRQRSVVRLLHRACTIAIGIGILNFLLFIGGTFIIGGDAINGKIENGRFYLWGYRDGAKQYTEVSRSVFEYSRWHCYAVFVTWPMVIVGGLVLNRLSRNN